MTDNNTIEYLLIHKDGSRKKITVPSDWKVTYRTYLKGPATPGDREMPIALRFYENETKQRAVFTDIVSFRDMSIPVLEEKIERKDKFGTLEVDGGSKRVSVVAETREWVDPDDETPSEEQCNLIEEATF